MTSFVYPGELREWMVDDIGSSMLNKVLGIGLLEKLGRCPVVLDGGENYE